MRNALKDLIKRENKISRSISPENFTGGKGEGGMATDGVCKEQARELGQGWKISPCIRINPGEKRVLADISGEGNITHIWCTCDPTTWKGLIFKAYWDNSLHPSIQTPLGDFFLNGWGERSLVSSDAICVNPAGGFNSYFQMPFKTHAKFEITNLLDKEVILYYQIDYELGELPKDALYFHAFFNRENPTKYQVPYTILPEIKGCGHYVGTYMAIQPNNNNWWGEGEFKFYMDGDKEFPTICTTGTEDYFGGAWNFELPKGEYCVFSTPYSGLHQVIKPDGLYKANIRFGMYRFHLLDPIRFNESLKVTVQALGWRSEGRFVPLQADIFSVAYWYQDTVNEDLKMNEDKNYIEVI